eukprot:CAMPEP_0198554648 /NCGR_PEP_ID=MMETSP1462-20131121/83029_1 /TAXON_ID=1333877 /ORGANISM="Brandtodinium nutriculum, Strain RCC3387" /LENGTH=126 /DNA_ID=CAMNT_0044285365 /DNA_START=18 /DNA_END=394 /DNA_ORIENTATION=-
MKAVMRREDVAQKRQEKAADRQEAIESRRQDMVSMNSYTQAVAQERKMSDLAQNREYQECKRHFKAVSREQESQQISEAYAETKENASYWMELKKIQLAEQPRGPIEENIETLQMVSEYKREEQRR